MDRVSDDFIEGSWEQTPPSIDDRNSTVAKSKTNTTTKNVLDRKTMPAFAKKAVQSKSKVNLGGGVSRQWVRRGFRRLRLFKHPGPVYHHKPD